MKMSRAFYFEKMFNMWKVPNRSGSKCSTRWMVRDGLFLRLYVLSDGVVGDVCGQSVGVKRVSSW